MRCWFAMLFQAEAGPDARDVWPCRRDGLVQSGWGWGLCFDWQWPVLWPLPLVQAGWEVRYHLTLFLLLEMWLSLIIEINSYGGETDLSWSVIRTDYAPRFSTHVISGFVAKFYHHRMKVFPLHVFLSNGNLNIQVIFKLFKHKNRQKRTHFSTRTLFSTFLTECKHRIDSSFSPPCI